MQPIVDYAGQFRVLDECDFVNVLLLIAPHEHILIQVTEVGNQVFLDEVSIKIGIVVLHVQEIVLIRARKHGLRLV